MSNLQKILSNFGFNQSRQIAVIDNFLIAGYFSDQTFWQALNLINCNFAGEKIYQWKIDQSKIFQLTKKIIDQAKNKKIVLNFYVKIFFLQKFLMNKMLKIF